MREAARLKGRRYLTEGRLIVRVVTPEEIRAVCRGDTGVLHSLGYMGGWWRCDCPAATTCSHLYALMSVTVVGSGALAAIGALTEADR